MTPDRRDEDEHGLPELDVRLLYAALDRQPVGIAILSVPDLVFVYANPAFQRFAPGKEIVGHPNAEVFPEMGFLAGPVLASLARGETWRDEQAVSRIRRAPDAPLETTYGTFEVSGTHIRGHPYVIVSATETTEKVLLSAEYERLHAEETRRLELAETLAEVYRVIHSSLDYDQVMQRSLEEATRVLGAKAGAVFVGLDGESEARYVTGFPRAMLGRKFPAAIFPFSEAMERTREPIAITEPEMPTLMNPALARLFRVRSLLAIPIVTKERLVGGIGLIYRQPHQFRPAEIDFARAFGGSLSLALENAELYRRQARVADTLQRALLTLPEKIGGVRFSHAYRSATEAVRVGGDFYDLFELEHEIVGVTLGDISGKGLDAAVLTSLVKNALRTKATEKHGSPAEVMRVANSVLLGASRPEEFATVFLGLLDCGSARLVYCNAGHTTGALLGVDGRIERLASNSSILGALPDASFAESTTRLTEGDLLFLYTDGLTEARRGKELFGEERVFDLLAEARPRGSAEVLDLVLTAVREFTGGELSDDLALLAFERTVPAETSAP